MYDHHLIYILKNSLKKNRGIPPFHKNYIIFRNAEIFKKTNFSKINLFWEGTGKNLFGTVRE
jgi:hypothetical protein